MEREEDIAAVFGALDAEEDDELEALNERIKEISRDRLAGQTRNTYGTYWRAFAKFLLSKHEKPDYLAAVAVSQNKKDHFGIIAASITELMVKEFLMDATGKNKKPLSPGALDCARSALRAVFDDQGVQVPAWFPNLKHLFRGLKKKRVECRRDGEEEGKSHLPYHLYVLLCTLLMRLRGTGHGSCAANSAKGRPKRFGTDACAFAHFFCTLSWNLMARCNNVGSISLKHLHWAGDCLGVHFANMKNDQLGEKLACEVKHLYANRFSPETCVVTSLGVYLSCGIQARSVQLFPGDSQNDRMNSILYAVFSGEVSTCSGTDAVVGALASLGKCAKDFATHSLRKGAATFVTAGSVAGPSIIAVLRRGGWSVGDVLGRYFRADSAGDQHVGRTLAGLPVTSYEFAALPPHFPVGALEQAGFQVDALLALVFPFVDFEAHKNMREVCIMCLASLTHHRKELVKNMHDSHPFHDSYAVRSGALERLSALVVTDENMLGVVHEQVFMKATGVPPHVQILSQLAKLERTMNREHLLAGIRDLLQSCAVSADRMFLMERMDKHRAEQREEIAELKDTLFHRLDDMNSAFETNTQLPAHRGGSLGLDLFNRTLPENWTLPRVSPATAWQLWWEGQPSKKIPPFRLLSARDLTLRREKQNLTYWKALMTHYVAQLQEFEAKYYTEVFIPSVMKQSKPKAGASLFAWKYLEARSITPPAKQKRGRRQVRVAQLSVITIARQIMKEKK